jgi:hypothetical protein
MTVEEEEIRVEDFSFITGQIVYDKIWEDWECSRALAAQLNKNLSGD